MDKPGVVAISDVLAETGCRAHGHCSKVVLHQVAEAETSLFSVEPGQRLAMHLHTETWDLFFVVSGLGEIRYRGKAGTATIPMPVRAFCAIPPGYEHEVCNLSATEPFSFLMIHAPWRGYDHVRTREKAPKPNSASSDEPSHRGSTFEAEQSGSRFEKL
jgi:mannose-6-phosphate isomerase-like protein (cupin superfamily)